MGHCSRTIYTIHADFPLNETRDSPEYEVELWNGKRVNGATNKARIGKRT